MLIQAFASGMIFFCIGTKFIFMFTGIVQELGIVQSIEFARGIMTYAVNCPPSFLDGARIGGSIAIDGVCQTLIEQKQSVAWFQAIQETLDVTTLKSLKVGHQVHLERSAKLGDEIGGHQLSGHVMGTAKVLDISPNGEDCQVLTCESPANLTPYLFPKGYIALDGASLTLVTVQHPTFSVHLIPETLRKTHFARKQVGSWLNIEIDPQTFTIVQTVEKWLQRLHEVQS